MHMCIRIRNFECTFMNSYCIAKSQILTNIYIHAQVHPRTQQARRTYTNMIDEQLSKHKEGANVLEHVQVRTLACTLLTSAHVCMYICIYVHAC